MCLPSFLVPFLFLCQILPNTLSTADIDDNWRFIHFTINKGCVLRRGSFLRGPIFLVKLLYRFPCGSTVWQIPARSLLKTSVEWSNDFIADSWVSLNFPLRVFYVSFCGTGGNPFICLWGFQGLWLTISPDTAFLGKPFWSLLATLVLWACDLPHQHSAFRRQGPCLSPYPVAADPGWEPERNHQRLPLLNPCWYFSSEVPFLPQLPQHSVSFYSLELAPSSLPQRTSMKCINYETFLQIKF